MRLLLALVISFFLIEKATAQLYYKGPEDLAWRIISEENSLLSSNGQDVGQAVLKSYQKRIKKAPVYIVDSVYAVVTTDYDGHVAAVLYSEAMSQANLDALLKPLQKTQLTGSGSHAFALLYPRLYVEAYPMWAITEPPNLRDCQQATGNGLGNLTFRKSCFAYVVQKKVLQLDPPPTSKKSMYAGYFNAAVTVTANGSATMVEFDSLSTNPLANDFFAENLHTVKFPQGGFFKGKQVGYVFQVQDEYFGITRLNYSQVDSSISLSANLLGVNLKDNALVPLVREELDTSIQENSELLNYHVGHRKFALRSDTSKVIMGNFLVAIVNSNFGARYSEAAVLTPTYFSSKSNDVYPAALPDCAKGADAEYASTCSSAALLSQFYLNISIPKMLDYWPGRLTKQVVYVNERGEVDRIQVTLGNYYAPFDLRVMHALSLFPAFKPGTLDGKPAPTIYTFISVLY